MSRFFQGPDVALVPQIGSIMRMFGQTNGNAEWEKAAKLQDLWLAFPKHVVMPVAPEVFDFSVVAWPSQTGITMDWALKNEVDSDGRAKIAYASLQASIVNDSGGKIQKIIQNQVNRLFTSTASNTVSLGGIKWSPDMNIKAFHAQHVQISTVKFELTGAFDPLLGALGSFNFYAIPIGVAQKRGDGQVQVTVTGFIVYIIDSFDFAGAQILGSWKAPDRISKLPFADSIEMTNGAYRDYRDIQNKGGDFLIISDTRTIPLTKNFNFSPEPTINGTWTSSDPKKRFVLAINGTSVEWTEIGPETGTVYNTTLKVTQQGDLWRIERPNDNQEVLKMLGFSDPNLRQAILSKNPHPSFLMLKVQGSQLFATWRGIRVKKTPQGAFQSLTQPEDPNNQPGNYTFSR